MKKWVSRGFMIAAIINFALSIWFAQDIVSGWLIYSYVVGSFALMCVAMTVAE